MPDGVRKAAGDPLEVGKDPVTALVPQPRQRVGKKIVVVHGPIPGNVAASSSYRDGNYFRRASVTPFRSFMTS